jgi:predicted DNA-binding protein YlxM (UPF0122 family)
MALNRNIVEIMKKLGVQDKRSIAGLLANKPLSLRILDEEPVRLSAFVKENGLPLRTIRKMIKDGVLSSFSNSKAPSSPVYIFANEFAPHAHLFTTDWQYSGSDLWMSITQQTKLWVQIMQETPLLNTKEKQILQGSIFSEGYSLEKMQKQYKLQRQSVQYIIDKVMQVMVMYAKEQTAISHAIQTIEELQTQIKGLMVQKKALHTEVDMGKLVLQKPNELRSEIKSADLQFGFRTINIINKLGSYYNKPAVLSVTDLISYTEAEIRALPASGNKVMHDIKKALGSLGLGLAM